MIELEWSFEYDRHCPTTEDLASKTGIAVINVTPNSEHCGDIWVEEVPAADEGEARLELPVIPRIEGESHKNALQRGVVKLFPQLAEEVLSSVRSLPTREDVTGLSVTEPLTASHVVILYDENKASTSVSLNGDQQYAGEWASPFALYTEKTTSYSKYVVDQLFDNRVFTRHVPQPPPKPTYSYDKGDSL